eukprot:6211046-Pleurochrysis_carterae.AAC.1
MEFAGISACAHCSPAATRKVGRPALARSAKIVRTEWRSCAASPAVEHFFAVRWPVRSHATLASTRRRWSGGRTTTSQYSSDTVPCHLSRHCIARTQRRFRKVPCKVSVRQNSILLFA